MVSHPRIVVAGGSDGKTCGHLAKLEGSRQVVECLIQALPPDERAVHLLPQAEPRTWARAPKVIGKAQARARGR